jgi:predicted O-linked N-acetylglucosamine transferase (SPINDLY family)
LALLAIKAHIYIYIYIYVYIYIALAMRPAAMHVHYLGFPSTIGASYIDYIIGDPVVSPPELVGYYTEKLLLLPQTFQVC